MSEFNWNQFTLRIPVSADTATLYSAWSTRQGIEHWFLRMSEYKSPDGIIRNHDEHVQPGDRYAWRWHGWPDDMEEHGEILACNGRDYFQFTFSDAGICTVTIKEEAGQSIVELVQSGIPSDDKGKHQFHLGCKTGWTFYLANLKSLMEGGIDLRNKNDSIRNVVNA